MNEAHLSDAEWKVMNVVWETAPTDARTVLEALEDETGWAYTTVKTMLQRLVDKGALRVRKVGIKSVYRPRIERDDAQRGALRALVDKAFGGMSKAMMHMLMSEETLSKRDRATLRRMLEANDADGGDA